MAEDEEAEGGRQRGREREGERRGGREREQEKQILPSAGSFLKCPKQSYPMSGQNKKPGTLEKNWMGGRAGRTLMLQCGKMASHVTAGQAALQCQI